MDATLPISCPFKKTDVVLTGIRQMIANTEYLSLFDLPDVWYLPKTKL